jgi:ubiquinone/menaquinone biosynthesis C-methylase UbiE
LKQLVFIISAVIALSVLTLTHANAQKPDVAYVATPDSVVEKMLDVAKVGPGDYLIDLGCGDGRINIAAAKRGAFGHGVDLDPELIKLANGNARKQGVNDKVFFLQENIYETNFSRATVIAMYLFPDINIKLRPKFLEILEPGTRIVSHDFGMDDWKPDIKIGRMESHAVLLWIVPAKAQGSWKWQSGDAEFTMSIKQKFQQIEAEVLADGAILEVKSSTLTGKDIRLICLDKLNQKEFVFSGQVEGNKISGNVQIKGKNGILMKGWEATREN